MGEVDRMIEQQLTEEENKTMINYELKEEGKKKFLVITCELPAKPEPSGSGKSDVYATTSGNVNTSLKINGKDLVVGLNAYTKK